MALIVVFFFFVISVRLRDRVWSTSVLVCKTRLLERVRGQESARVFVPPLSLTDTCCPHVAYISHMFTCCCSPLPRLLHHILFAERYKELRQDTYVSFSQLRPKEDRIWGCLLFSLVIRFRSWLPLCRSSLCGRSQDCRLQRHWRAPRWGGLMTCSTLSYYKISAISAISRENVLTDAFRVFVDFEPLRLILIWVCMCVCVWFFNDFPPSNT